MENKKLLITGGAGYIGSYLIGYLLNKDYKITCIDNLMYGQKSLLNYVSNENFEFIYGDVRDERLMKKNIPNHEYIMPLAAIVGAPACEDRPIEAISVNKDAIILIDKLRSLEQKIICPISTSGYGTKSEEIFCNEDSPCEPISLYAKTKVEAENYLLNSNKPSVTLRLATVFGISPRMRTDLMVNDFVYQAVTNKSIVLFEKNFKRNYVHIKDIARVFEHSINHFENMKNNAYNVGLESANMSKLELAIKIKQHIPDFEIYQSENGNDPDKRNYLVSTEKLRKAGFEAEITLDQGIKELIKGYNILLKRDPNKNV